MEEGVDSGPGCLGLELMSSEEEEEEEEEQD